MFRYEHTCIGLTQRLTESSDGKNSGPSSANMWDRPNQREHGSAYGSMSHQKTEYIQILRVVYHQPPATVATTPGGGGAGSALSGSVVPTGSKLYYKTFTPAALRRVPVPGASAAGGGLADDGDPTECTYEDLRQLEDKINAWLSYTGDLSLLT